jgi:hypothetical protein
MKAFEIPLKAGADFGIDTVKMLLSKKATVELALDLIKVTEDEEREKIQEEDE